jgi:hypothetical protein
MTPEQEADMKERIAWIEVILCFLLGMFFWGASSGLTECREVVEPVLEAYQQALQEQP